MDASYALRLGIALAAALLAARVVGGAASRLRQPRVVGEMLAGVLVGPSLFGGASAVLFAADVRPAMGLVGELGVLLFSFLVGLGVDRTRVAASRRSLLLVVGGSIGGPVVVGLALSVVMYGEALVPAHGTSASPGRLAFGLAIAGLLAVSALPVMARILQEERQDATAHGTLAIAAGAATTVLMFLVLRTAAVVHAGASVAGVIAAAGASLGFVATMLLVVRPVLDRAAARLSGSGLLAAVLAVCAASSMASRELGLSVVVGAFLAGLVAPRGRPALEAGVERLRTPVVVVLLPIFLAVSGLQTDLRLLHGGALAGVGGLLVAAVLAKVVPVTIAARLGGERPSEALRLGVLLNCRGLLVLVASLALLEQQLVTPTVQVASVVVAVTTTLATAPACRWLGRRATVGQDGTGGPVRVAEAVAP